MAFYDAANNGQPNPCSFEILGAVQPLKNLK